MGLISTAAAAAMAAAQIPWGCSISQQSGGTVRQLLARMLARSVQHGMHATAGASEIAMVDNCRAHSHMLASTSAAPSGRPNPEPSAPARTRWHLHSEALRWPRHSAPLLPAATSLDSTAACSQQLRAYGYAPPKRRFRLPDSIAQIAEQAARAIPRPTRRGRVVTLEERPLTEASLRVGCIATKAGMTQDWDEYGQRVPLTLLWIDECQVVGIKTPDRHGRYALQLGAGHKRQKTLSPSAAGFFLSAGVPFKRLMAEWPVSADALLPVGAHICSSHFVAGQRVDVTGWTKRKGFQGVMKRWGFKGLPASHGVSLSHRHPGSIGYRQDPGKIFKGTKLPGHMGNERRTVHNCLVYKVDHARNIVYVRGQVPGPAGKSVFLRDSRLASHAVRAQWGLPFPTHIPSAASGPGPEAVLGAPEEPSVYRNPKDPYRMYREETDYQPIQWKKGD